MDTTNALLFSIAPLSLSQTDFATIDHFSGILHLFDGSIRLFMRLSSKQPAAALQNLSDRLGCMRVHVAPFVHVVEFYVESEKKIHFYLCTQKYSARNFLKDEAATSHATSKLKNKTTFSDIFYFYPSLLWKFSRANTPALCPP